MAAADRRAARFSGGGFQSEGMTVARLAGRAAGGSHGPQGLPSVLGGTGCGWSGGVRDGLDALPGGGDGAGPGPGRGYLQAPAAPAASAAGQAGGGVHDAVVQGLGLGYR